MNASCSTKLLIGEINATGGEPGVGFQLILDAARKDRAIPSCTAVPPTSLQARPAIRHWQRRAWRQAPQVHRVPTDPCCRS